ncbi:hcs1 [Symbiodinium sp. CCMP2456]|nr:hcs1 [Symbiodinium sp. CCMP2456]
MAAPSMALAELEPPTVPATACELAEIGKTGVVARSFAAGPGCLEGDDVNHTAKKRRVLRAASSLAPNSMQLEIYSDLDAGSLVANSTSQLAQDACVDAGAGGVDDEENELKVVRSANVAPRGRKRPFLRAASSLAPSQSTWRDSPSPVAEDDVQEEVEAPGAIVQEVVQQQLSDAHGMSMSPEEAKAASMVERCTTTVFNNQGTIAPTLVVESESRGTKCWLDCSPGHVLPENQMELLAQNGDIETVAPTCHGRSESACVEQQVLLEVSSIEPANTDVPTNLGTLTPTLVVESENHGVYGTKGELECSLGPASPALQMELRSGKADEVATCHGRSEPARVEQQLVDNGTMPGLDTVLSKLPRQPARRRIVGKQRVPALSKNGSVLIRQSLGHTLRPPEAGFLVRVQGDGWGGRSSGSASFLATITEADDDTYTVIRRGDCHGSWDETHVLKRECSILARTSSQQDMYLHRVHACSI